MSCEDKTIKCKVKNGQDFVVSCECKTHIKIKKVSAEVNWTLIKRKVEVKEGSEKFFTLTPF